MLKKLNDFLNSITAVSNNNAQQAPTLEVACAVLLCEVMRADHDNTKQELDTLKHLISTQFSLTEEQVSAVISLAIELSENASDFYQFTKVVNEHYSLEERIKIVSLLWQVAYADGELDNIEEHIIRRIADLLHLRHTEYVATKIDAKTNYGKH